MVRVRLISSSSTFLHFFRFLWFPMRLDCLQCLVLPSVLVMEGRAAPPPVLVDELALVVRCGNNYGMWSTVAVVVKNLFVGH